jgi:hypothetical protein
MNITNYYNPEEGLAVMSRLGTGKYTEALDSYSQIFSQIKTTSSNNKCCIDSAWETGNIYYVDSGYVEKIKYSDFSELASLSLSNPVAVSVIQNAYKMNSTVTYPPQEEKGCWIADNGSGKLIKTDNNLNILVEVTGFTTPLFTFIATDVDDGCIVSDDFTGAIYKISSDGVVMASITYSHMGITGVREIKTYISTTFHDNRIWFLGSDEKIHGLRYDGIIHQWGVINPLDDLSYSSSSSAEESHVSCIDVDRNTNELYVVGGNSYHCWMLKYDEFGNIITKGDERDIPFPYIVRVVQSYNSNTIYILNDSSKWDEYGYDSSSSSSTEIRSSSSSSSSSTEIRSSSSTSSSSSENIIYGSGFATYPEFNVPFYYIGIVNGHPSYSNYNMSIPFPHGNITFIAGKYRISHGATQLYEKIANFADPTGAYKLSSSGTPEGNVTQ